MQARFSDRKHRLSDFQDEVWVCCKACNNEAIARVDHELKIAKLVCNHCGLNKVISTTTLSNNGKEIVLILPAHAYFDADLWFSQPFKNEIFFALNPSHLLYLEEYIRAKLREHKDRTHFTLLEKLPRFYHEAKNRDALLKIIEKLKKK
jgi:hypothetical protein